MEQEIILEARNITKVYPGGVVANHNVNLQIKKGEIHALVGENGAGKSTLMKMLFGMLAPTEGQIFVDGKEVHFSSSSDAIAAGLGMVHQHFMQVPSMTVAENLILGAEPGTALKVDRKEAVRITTELSDKYNLKVEAKEKVEDISLAMQAGWSTAPDDVRSLGFGAGMGLPNMKKYTDEMKIESTVGVGTTVSMTVFTHPQEEAVS